MSDSTELYSRDAFVAHDSSAVSFGIHHECLHTSYTTRPSLGTLPVRSRRYPREYSEYRISPLEELNEWTEVQDHSLRATDSLVELGVVSIALMPARVGMGFLEFRTLAGSGSEQLEHREERELAAGVHLAPPSLRTERPRATIVRLDGEAERLLEELVPEYGGVANVLRHALRVLVEDDRRRKALKSFLKDWHDEAGPVDEAEVAEMAQRYGL